MTKKAKAKRLREQSAILLHKADQLRKQYDRVMRKAHKLNREVFRLEFP